MPVGHPDAFFIREMTTTTDLLRRDQLVIENLSLVKAIAMRVRGSLPVHVDLDDLMNAGVMGLMDAATKFDAEKDVTFRTYAKHRIKGAILDSLRQQDWASRDMRRRHKKLEEVTRELSAELDRPPDDREIADKMGVGVERWRLMALELRTIGLLSASARTADGENDSVPEFPANDELRPDMLCERQELSAKLRYAIGTLPGRYQDVVFMYYTREMTMKEIGSKMSINESRVSQIHKTALEKMAVVLTAGGIESSAAFV
jgi:RNA polymerase sigma factor for flagellar operon FliA